MSRSLSTSPAASQQGGMTDAPFDSLIDYSGYDNTARSESPSLSPGASKALFAPSSIKTESSTAGQMVPAPQQQMSGPSHQYDLYKQQTGIVPGALATTLAVNLTAEVQGYTNFNLDFLGSNDVFDFNCFPSQASMSTPSLDNMDFEASPTGDFFFGEPTVNPNSVGGQEPHSLSPPPALAAQTSNVGRMWPGMHKQAALAKAQAQQEQQQQIIQQQRHQRQRSVVSQCQAKTAHRNLSAQPSDPLVEQKITQLLNSMRGKASDDDAANMPHLNMARSRKDEDDMDEDERLLASEEGKKLSSKERRQLRNKVSARAFRSRRKEYIGQLEAEIANKVSETCDLRAQNRALLDENKRLTELSRMLLSSPSFSDFLGRLSSNPQQTMPLLPRPSQQQPQQTAEPGQRPKDVNPYASQQAQQHQIGMAMIPEQNMDFSTRSLNGESGASFFQPQVYAVLETPEFPIAPVDVSALAGKSSNLVGEQFNDKDAKADTPTVKGCPTPVETKPAGEQNDRAVDQPVDDAFENDPAFALWHTAPVDETETSTTSPRSEHVAASPGNFFGSIEPEKAWARYDLVDAATRERNEKVSMAVAMSRLHQITAKLDRMAFLLDSLVEDC